MSEGGGAFAERTSELRRSGFNVDTPVGDDASSEILHLERKAQQAKKLKLRISALPDRWDEQRTELLSKLTNPTQVDAVRAELNGLLRRNRPWVLAAERAASRWSEEGRSAELRQMLVRLDSIDEELVFGATRLVGLIEDAAPKQHILPVIVEVEQRQDRRIKALFGMVDMLESKGWDVGVLSVGRLHDRFSAADSLRRLDMQLSRIHRTIEADIRPFDGVLAEKLWSASMLAQQEATEVAMLKVEKEGEKRVGELRQRLIRMESQLSRWATDGFHLGVKLPLLPQDLLDWEAKHSQIEEKVEATHALWARIVPYLEQWPEHRKLAKRTHGHIEAIDALEVLLTGLKAKTEAATVACRNRLEEWANAGIDISHWADLYENEPRAVEEELNDYQQVVNVIIPIIDGLSTLDLSSHSPITTNEWLDELRSPLPPAEALQGASDYLAVMQKRNSRHRRSLDEARESLIGLWPANVDLSSLDLGSYERLVVALESGDPIHEARSPVSIDTERLRNHRRIATILSEEIDGWTAIGWETSGLIELSEQDPLRLGLDLPEIRDAMQKHENLRGKLATLPWNRNPSLAERVLSDLSRPERLPALIGEIPELMRKLSESDDGGADYEFSPFIPAIPPTQLKSHIPVLIPKQEGEDNEETVPEIEVAEVDEAKAKGAVALGEMIGVDDSVRRPQVKGPPSTRDAADFSAESKISDSEESTGPGTIDWSTADEGEGLDEEFAELVGKVEVKRPKAKPIEIEEPTIEETEISSPITDRKPTTTATTAMPIISASPAKPAASVARVTTDSGPLNRIAKSLGIATVADVTELTDALSKVIDPSEFVPIDVRVQRLTRLMLLSIPSGDDDAAQDERRAQILVNLCSLAKRLERWSGERLASRHESSGAGLLEDSILLAKRLAAIPGPGVQIPTDLDSHQLPSRDDLAGLSVAAARLTRAVKLPSAAIVQEAEAAA